MSDAPETTDLSLEDIQALRAENERLKTEAAAERTARQEADRRADGLYSTSVSKDHELANAQLNSLAAQEAQATAAVASIAVELTTLKSQQAAMFAEGKFDEAAEIGEKMADAAARRQQAQQGKAYFAQQRESAAKQPVDPVDRFLAQNNYSEAEKEWIKKNPRFATDKDFQARVARAHAELADQGIAPQSAEYFQGLERAGYQRPPPASPPPPPPVMRPGVAETSEGGSADSPYSESSQEEPPVQTPPARQPTRSGVAASPSHRAPSTPQRGAQTPLTLTADEHEAAMAMSEFMPEEVQAEGPAGILAYYQKLKTSPMAKRLKSEWASGG